MKPSICRMVIYQHGETPIAAVITAVDEESGRVQLTLFPPRELAGLPLTDESNAFDPRGVLQAPGDKPKSGHWHWPPRV